MGFQLKFSGILSICLIVLTAFILYFQPLFSNEPLGLDTLSHLSKVSYMKEYHLPLWDMSWYNGAPFLKFYSPLFYYLLFFFNNLFFAANLLCFLSVLLCAVGIFFLVRHYSGKNIDALIASLCFLSVISFSYYWISTGNDPFIFSLWSIPFTLLFLEKSFKNSNYFLLYSLFFLIGFLSHILTGFVLLFVIFIRFLIQAEFKLKKILNAAIYLLIPIGLTAFWFIPFLMHSSSFIGEFEINHPTLLHLLGIQKSLTWGIGFDSIGIGFGLFIFLLFFFKRNLKDKIYLYALICSISLFLLLEGLLGHFYPSGIGSIRFIIPFSIFMCIFIGISLAKLNLKKAYYLLFVLILISLVINFYTIKTNYEKYSYCSDEGKFGSIYKEFYEPDFPIKNEYSNYRFGSARFPFTKALTFVFPKVSQTGGYYDQGILYPSTFWKMKEGIWSSNDTNQTLYYLDWFGIKYFELSGGYLENEKKFLNDKFKFITQRNTSEHPDYPYKIYEYLNAKPIVSVVKTNFVSFRKFDENFIDNLIMENKNTETIIPFISEEQINISNEYLLLDSVIKRESPDNIEISFNFSGKEGVFFREFYYPSWKAKEFPSGKELLVYRTSNDMMLVLPSRNSHQIILYQSKNFIDYFAKVITIISLFGAFFFAFRRKSYIILQSNKE